MSLNFKIQLILVLESVEAIKSAKIKVVIQDNKIYLKIFNINNSSFQITTHLGATLSIETVLKIMIENDYSIKNDFMESNIKLKDIKELEAGFSSLQKLTWSELELDYAKVKTE